MGFRVNGMPARLNAKREILPRQTGQMGCSDVFYRKGIKQF
jgi:hypothetical protein